MGNSQLQSRKQQLFIQPKKLQQTTCKSRILPDLNTQLQQLFGVSQLPASHHTLPSKTPENLRKLFDSACIIKQLSPQDKQYEERIALLEQQLYNLRHVVQQMKDPSRLNQSVSQSDISPLEQRQTQQQTQQEESLEIPVAESDYHQINHSISHINLSYFRSNPREVNQQNNIQNSVNPSQFSASLQH